MNLYMTRSLPFNRQTLKSIVKCGYATTSKTSTIVSELEVEEVPVYEVEPTYEEEKLDRIRNKSRLMPQDRNILHGIKPYSESYADYHDTIVYRKKLLGRYGIEAAGINPAIAWPTKSEIEDRKEYERLAYPYTIQEQWKQIEDKKREEAEEVRKREEEIDKVVANLDKWRVALNEKIAKKEADLLEAKMRKERVMEEIREQFGFNIDPKDERVKELLAKKEKEDKKKKKEARKKKQEEKLLAFLSQQEQELQRQKEQEQLNDVEAKSSEGSDNKNENKKSDQ